MYDVILPSTVHPTLGLQYGIDLNGQPYYYQLAPPAWTWVDELEYDDLYYVPTYVPIDSYYNEYYQYIWIKIEDPFRQSKIILFFLSFSSFLETEAQKSSKFDLFSIFFSTFFKRMYFLALLYLWVFVLSSFFYQSQNLYFDLLCNSLSFTYVKKTKLSQTCDSSCFLISCSDGLSSFIGHFNSASLAVSGVGSEKQWKVY